MLSSGSEEILLLCSHLGLVKGSELVPLNRREWILLEQKIQSSEVEGVQKLPGMTAQEIQTAFAISEEEAKRIARLLDRHDSMMSELERLHALGIRVITRLDQEYPERYRQRLKESAPVILFLAGEAALLGQPGIAVVGSRNLDMAGQECASFVGNACGLSGLVLYSGGARGADTISTMAALESRGSAVSVLAEGMEKTIKLRDVQRETKTRRSLPINSLFAGRRFFSWRCDGTKPIDLLPCGLRHRSCERCRKRRHLVWGIRSFTI